jgi:hypothetical protein
VEPKEQRVTSHVRRIVALGVALVGFASAAASAQVSRRTDAGTVVTSDAQSGPPRVDVFLPSSTSLSMEGPAVRPAQILEDNELRDLIRNGFPAQLHFRVELWSNGRWIDDFEGKAEWDLIVRYDPLGKSYHVLRIIGENVETVGDFVEYAGAIAAVEKPYRSPLIPMKSRRGHYYNVVLDVEVLSVSDLDELDMWLRGELRPAVRGRRNPATALTRGVRTLMVRLLGGEKRRYVQRSETFRIPRS